MPLLDAFTGRSRERLEKIGQAVDAVFDVVKDAKPSDRPPSRISRLPYRDWPLRPNEIDRETIEHGPG
jgi:hypothetical protein